MDRRSTNVKGHVHFGGDVRSGVEDGIGFSLGSASTGSTAWIESISDDTNAHLGLRAQGAGTITIGTSSNKTVISGGLTGANSTFANVSVSSNCTVTGTLKVGTGDAMKGIYSTTFAYAYAALSSGQTEEITLSTAVGDIAPGDLVSVSLGATSTNTGLAILNLRFSTAAASRVTITVGNITSTAFGSTGSGTGRIQWIDLT